MTINVKISEFRLFEISKLKHRAFVAEFGGKWNPAALILEFCGTYGHGSIGNDDADFIHMIRSGATAILNVEAVVYDFRNMDYEWGNRIWNVLPCPRGEGEEAMPTAMVISDRCRKGFSTCAGMVPPMFETLDEALVFVEPIARAYVNELLSDVE